VSEVSVVLNGLSQAMLLFLVASGLSLIFGLMGVVNFAHGAFFMLGGYATVVVLGHVESFWLALLLAPIMVAVVGALVEYVLIRPLYDRDAIYQVLLTFGLAIALEELVILIWTTETHLVSPPEAFQGVSRVLGALYPTYRLFIIGVGFLAVFFLYVLINRTKIGITVRAGTLDKDLVEALGVNIRRLYTMMFALGIGLAALGGVLAAPIVNVYPVMGTEILIQSFVVVVVGGIGSIRGSFVAAVLIGMIQSFGAVYFSQLTGFVVFLLLIVVLLLRPSGLFGIEEMLE
jgi:branched-subunit amino acid ABC-type transport system permease component